MSSVSAAGWNNAREGKHTRSPLPSPELWQKPLCDKPISQLTGPRPSLSHKNSPLNLASTVFILCRKKKKISLLLFPPSFITAKLSSFYMDFAILFTLTYLGHSVTTMSQRGWGEGGILISITFIGTQCVWNTHAVQDASYPAWFNRNQCGKILYQENTYFDI